MRSEAGEGAEAVVDLGRTERSLVCCRGAWSTYFREAQGDEASETPCGRWRVPVARVVVV